MIHNPNPILFRELEDFLSFYHKDELFPISIQNVHFDHKQILYNIEQLTRPDMEGFISFIKDNTLIYEIWDYSLSNIQILNKFGIYNTKYVPFKIWPSYYSKLLSFNPNHIYDFDIGFCGWVYGDHRIKLLNEIQASGLTIDIIDNLYGDQRDEKLAKCRILLNIHFNENYRIFELYRCFPWLDTGKIVVSETSLDNDPRCVNVEYTEILPTLKLLLNK